MPLLLPGVDGVSEGGHEDLVFEVFVAFQFRVGSVLKPGSNHLTVGLKFGSSWIISSTILSIDT